MKKSIAPAITAAAITATAATTAPALAATVASAAIAADNKSLVSFSKALETFAKASGTFRQKTLATIETLRKEGFSDAVIKAALREVIKAQPTVTPQTLNRILAEVMGNERSRSSSPDKSAKGAAPAAPAAPAKPAAPASVEIKIKEPESLFAALLVAFEGDALAIMSVAEKLMSLSMESLRK